MLQYIYQWHFGAYITEHNTIIIFLLFSLRMPGFSWSLRPWSGKQAVFMDKYTKQSNQLPLSCRKYGPALRLPIIFFNRCWTVRGKKVIGERPKDRRAKCSVDCRSTSKDPFLSAVLFFIYYGGVIVCPFLFHGLSPMF
jgi:hypothetical protein